ncbi:MAG: hypothetical protein DWI24_11250 [Planctomycetota bacterium]|nr:MAG: hypothetical protein DWI24_11250 [Planctomycetota bacterium]
MMDEKANTATKLMILRMFENLQKIGWVRLAINSGWSLHRLSTGGRMLYRENLPGHRQYCKTTGTRRKRIIFDNLTFCRRGPIAHLLLPRLQSVMIWPEFMVRIHL